jgi:hypothetical protein
MNNEFVCCLLDLGVTNLFMTLQVMEHLGVKTKLVVDPIMMHLAQGIVRLSLSVMVGVELFRGGIQPSSF